MLNSYYDIDTYLESVLDDYYDEGFKDGIKKIGKGVKWVGDKIVKGIKWLYKKIKDFFMLLFRKNKKIDNQIKEAEKGLSEEDKKKYIKKVKKLLQSVNQNNNFFQIKKFGYAKATEKSMYLVPYISLKPASFKNHQNCEICPMTGFDIHGLNLYIWDFFLYVQMNNEDLAKQKLSKFYPTLEKKVNKYKSKVIEFSITADYNIESSKESLDSSLEDMENNTIEDKNMRSQIERIWYIVSEIFHMSSNIYKKLFEIKEEILNILLNIEDADYTEIDL